MAGQVNHVVVVGDDVDAMLAALILRIRIPYWNVTLVLSESSRVANIDESTTPLVPNFLHNVLGFGGQAFMDEVRPVWKLGIRFDWGSEDAQPFNYPYDHHLDHQLGWMEKVNAYCCMDDLSATSHFSLMMDKDLSPFIRLPNGSVMMDNEYGYHLEHGAFKRFLTDMLRVEQVAVLSGYVSKVSQGESGNVDSLQLDDGRVVSGDMFVDGTGEQSLLLHQTMGEQFVAYDKSLLCDSVLMFSRPRTTEAVRPYTTVQTMDNGWSWQVDHDGRISYGYVYSSRFTDESAAISEMQLRYGVGQPVARRSMKQGRYQNFWSGNVFAVGDASGVIEPLQSTKLHTVVEQSRYVGQCLFDARGHIHSRMVALENHRYRRQWDAIRDFLAMHYRFNYKRDTPFWNACREQTDLGEAARIVEYFQQAGPSTMVSALTNRNDIGRYTDYMTMLIGQGVPTNCPAKAGEQDRRIWDEQRNRFRENVSTAMSVPQARSLLLQPQLMAS